jgi:hypothetical protein
LPRQLFRGSAQKRSGDFFIIFRRFAFHDIFAAAASLLPFRDAAATLFSILPSLFSFTPLASCHAFITLMIFAIERHAAFESFRH